MQAAAREVQSATGKAPEAATDFRRVLDAREVDAVFIATPDHWHGPASILALNAGKHVYVEKPCCHNIREGWLMAEACKRTGRLLQVGTQSRSTRFVKDAIARVHAGEIGDVLVAKAWNSQRRGSIGKATPSEPPAHLDFDLWLGPAPVLPFRKNLLLSSWRWFYDFGCGDIGNDGVHDIDVALWGLGVDTHPARATRLGDKLFFDDDQEFPDTQCAAFEYPATDGHRRKRQFIFEQRIWSPHVQEGYENGAAFYGTEGVLILGHSVGWKHYGPRNQLRAEGSGPAGLAAHHQNFFDCIRGDAQQLNANVDAGVRAATIVHLANIAARVAEEQSIAEAKQNGGHLLCDLCLLCVWFRLCRHFRRLEARGERTVFKTCSCKWTCLHDHPCYTNMNLAWALTIHFAEPVNCAPCGSGASLTLPECWRRSCGLSSALPVWSVDCAM